MSQPARSDSTDSSNLQRLQRVMAAAGIGSRRECEVIIQEGRVEVDGQIVATLGAKVDPAKDKIFVDGQRITQQRLEYYMLNKPPGVVSTSHDPSGRARVIDLIKSNQRVYNVGRLDQSSEGLILVTNDGDLANQLTHPKYGIDKKYHVKVDGVPTPLQLKSLEEGIYIAEGKAQAKSAKLLRKSDSNSWLEMVLSEGKNREIRRILAKLGHKVRVLKRVAIGPLKLADLPVGAHRKLTLQELKELKRAANGLAPAGKSKKVPKKFQAKKSTRTSAPSSRTSKTSGPKPSASPFTREGSRVGNREAKRDSKRESDRSSDRESRNKKSSFQKSESGAVGRPSKNTGQASRSKRSSGPKQISQLTKFGRPPGRDSASTKSRPTKTSRRVTKKRG